MRKGVVSVVVPVFNVEQYLNRCVKSVVNQSYKDLEIILVDDGSPDSCPQMCDEWAKKDPRIKVVHKKNAGLGYARNTGIENATGEYICFFDSDDYIALDTIEKAYGLANKEKADVVVFGHCPVSGSGVTREPVIPCPKKLIYEESEILETFLPDLIAPNTSTGEFTNLWMSVCGALYSMELIDNSNWRLVSERDIISEDVYSLLRLYKDVRKVAVIPEALYFYCENAASLTHTYKSDRFERIEHFYRECIDACNELEYSDEVKRRLAYPFISNTIAAMKMVERSQQSRVEKTSEIKNFINSASLQSAVNAISLKREKSARKLLILAIKHKSCALCYFLVAIKNKEER